MPIILGLVIFPIATVVYGNKFIDKYPVSYGLYIYAFIVCIGAWVR